MRRGKKLATLPHNADGPEQVSSLTGTSQHTDRIWDLSLPLLVRINEEYDWACMA